MTTAFPKERELVLDRFIDLPRALIWRCWTEPDLMKQWYCPAPWSIRKPDIDLRPGGRSNIIMVDPDGKEHPNLGIYLEVVEGEKLVFTDAFTEGWLPSPSPFMVATITLSDEYGGTRYRAVARHFSEEARKQHEEMGFEPGWNAACDQLIALARTL